MTDVSSVVAQLKLTPKGKLRYGRDDVESLSDSLTKLYISPYTSKNLQNFNDTESSPLEISSDCYSNYFTVRKEKKHVSVPTPTKKEIPSHKEKTESSSPSIMKDKGVISNDSPDKYMKPFDNTLQNLRSIDEEYQEQSKNLQQKRLCEYYMNIQQFDLEHFKSIETIERSVLIKQNEEMKQIDEDQNRTSEELAYYQAVKEEREFVASEKLRLAELHRKEIEIKIKKDNALKAEKLAKKKTLAGFAEPGLKILNMVTQIYVEKTKENNCDELKNIMDRINKEHAELSNIVNQGLKADTSEELDMKIQVAREKLNNLSALQKNSQDISKQFEEKALREQKAKEEAEKKQKERIETAAKEQAERAKQTPVAALEEKPTSSSNIPPIENPLNIASSVPALIPIEPMLKPMLQMFVPKSVFRDYLRLSKLITDTEKSYETLNKPTTKEKKAYKFDLYKVVNTTINAISDESPRHLMDKIKRLSTLLSGRDVVNGEKRVSTKQDPQAMMLSKDLIAKKLVLQGSTQVASSYKAAFGIAAVVLGLWAQFPDVGELLMGHFFVKCPYTVPFYIPKSAEISTVDYCKLVGYSVDGAEVESEDKYLKKLSGLIRLYAAIISSEIPPSLGNRTHPLGLDHGWAWLTRVLNLEPRPVTATIIYDFLEVAGHVMMKRYGKQFRKLLLTLYQDVMPKILEVTPKESKAGAMRLQIFLDSCIKEGRMKPPDGYLTKAWYNNPYYR